MISLYEKNLIRSRQELRDLKTVHERGLSTVRFFRYRATANVGGGTNWTTFRATIATGEPERPLFVAQARGTSTKTVMAVEIGYASATTVEARIQTSRSDTITVDLISSSVMTGWSKA